MKKNQYIAPMTQIIKVQTTNMIAISSAMMSIKEGDRITSEDAFGSRCTSNIWDDDDYEQSDWLQ